MERMSHYALSFLSALGVDQFDILGFSIGRFVAQGVALMRTDTERRSILVPRRPEAP